jgi:hypothetical protein
MCWAHCIAAHRLHIGIADAAMYRAKSAAGGFSCAIDGEAMKL